MAERKAIQISITNLTESQAIAIEDMLATWQLLGGWGSSRWTSFFADGDGNFRPRISIDGRKPQETTLVKRADLWTGGATGDGEYKIDFDKIAWKLQGDTQ